MIWPFGFQLVIIDASLEQKFLAPTIEQGSALRGLTWALKVQRELSISRIFQLVG